MSIRCPKCSGRMFKETPAWVKGTILVCVNCGKEVALPDTVKVGNRG